MFFECAVFLYKGGGCRVAVGNIMPTATFSFDGEHVFLTYPQCPLERQQLLDFILRIEPNAEYIVARERHDDGSPHLHAYVHFGRRRRFASERAFDVDGYHPNIQKPRNKRNVIEYCRKEDDQPLVSIGLAGLCGETTGWGEVLAVSTSREEFLERTRERFPRDYVLSLERLLFFCEWRFGKSETSYRARERSSFREPDSLKEWVFKNLTQVLIYTPFPPLRLPPPLHLFN